MKGHSRRCASRFRRRASSLAALRPVHAPAVGRVERRLGALHVANLAAHRQVGTGALQQRDSAGTRAGVGLVELDLDRRAALRVQGDDGAGACPVRRALVDVGEDEDAADLAEPGQVDPQVFSSGALPGPVVAVERDDRRALVARPARVAEGLHDALLAVAELVQAGQIQIDALRLALEEAAGRGPGVPVQVDPQFPAGAAALLLAQRDGRRILGEGHLAETDAAPLRGAGTGVASAAWSARRFRTIDDTSAAPMKPTPISPVTRSGTFCRIVMKSSTASAPMAQWAPCSR